MGQWNEQIEKVKQYAEIVKEYNLIELEITNDKIRLKKGNPKNDEFHELSEEQIKTAEKVRNFLLGEYQQKPQNIIGNQENGEPDISQFGSPGQKVN